MENYIQCNQAESGLDRYGETLLDWQINNPHFDTNLDDKPDTSLIEEFSESIMMRIGMSHEPKKCLVASLPIGLRNLIVNLPNCLKNR